MPERNQVFIVTLPMNAAKTLGLPQRIHVDAVDAQAAALRVQRTYNIPARDLKIQTPSEGNFGDNARYPVDPVTKDDIPSIQEINYRLTRNGGTIPKLPTTPQSGMTGSPMSTDEWYGSGINVASPSEIPGGAVPFFSAPPSTVSNNPPVVNAGFPNVGPGDPNEAGTPSSIEGTGTPSSIEGTGMPGLSTPVMPDGLGTAAQQVGWRFSSSGPATEWLVTYTTASGNPQTRLMSRQAAGLLLGMGVDISVADPSNPGVRQTFTGNRGADSSGGTGGTGGTGGGGYTGGSGGTGGSGTGGTGTGGSGTGGTGMGGSGTGGTGMGGSNPAGGLTGSGAGIVDPLVGDNLPESAFREYLRSQGVNPFGTGGFLASSQYRPALQAFLALNSQGLIPEGTSFSDLLRTGTLGPRQFGELFKTALGAVNPAEGTEILGEGGTFTDFARNVANLAQGAVYGGRSPLVADFGQGTTARLQQALQDMTYRGQGGVTPETFAQYAFNFMGGNRQPNAALTQRFLGR